MSELAIIPVVYGIVLGIGTAFGWFTNLADRWGSERLQRQANAKASPQRATSPWVWNVAGGFGVLWLFVVISLKSQPQPVKPTNFQPAVPPVASTKPPAEFPASVQPTEESLQAWYNQLAARRPLLLPNDLSAIHAFNAEAAFYSAAVERYRSAQSFLPAPLAPAPNNAGLPGATTLLPSSTREHYVPSYTRDNGTVVTGYYQTNPDQTVLNNYSTRGNVNPHTGRIGTVGPFGFAPRSTASLAPLPRGK